MMIGWNGTKAIKLADWLTWRKEVEDISKKNKKVVAVNGRFFN